jgi:serine/threonine protein phosphatase PrpC
MRLSARFVASEKGGKQYNEDRVFQTVFPNPKNPKVIIGCVYDGHGGFNGELAAIIARDFSESFFKTRRIACIDWSVDEWKSQLTELFDTIHEEIRKGLISNGAFRFADLSSPHRVVRSADGFPINGGTTGTVVVQLLRSDGSTTVISANVGDSSAMISYQDGTGVDKFELLTVDHAPENEDEFKRISELPSAEYPVKLLLVYDVPRIPQRFNYPLVWPKDPKLDKNPWGNGLHPANVRYEPATYAVTPREVSIDTTCIAMTRSLGDFYAHQFGLTHKPEIRVLELPPCTKRIDITVASDGLWDCWKYEDYDAFCRKSSGKEILTKTVDLAIATFGAKHFDDTSVVVWRTESKH